MLFTLIVLMHHRHLFINHFCPEDLKFRIPYEKGSLKIRQMNKVFEYSK